jgi:hypothetical protein
LSKGVTPCLPKKWLERTRILADVIDSFFGNQKKAEYDKLPEEEKHLIKKDYFPIDRIKDEFTTLMIDFQNDKRTIVSFLLSALLNNISKKKDGFRLFADRKTDKAFLLIDLALFMYTFSPTFDSTRKFVSMIVYMNDEVHFNNKDSLENKKLENAIRRYSFIFHRGNLPDLCDWFPFLAEFSIDLDTVTENIIIEKAMQDNNPIIFANILLYSRYYTPFFENIKNKVEAIVETQISRMSHKQQMMQVEFWYALIFHNCSFLSASLRIKIESIIDDIESVAINEISNPNTSSKLSARTTLLVCDFLKQKLPNGRKPRESFYNWSESKKISEQITYRTLQRTIFKRYRGNRYGLY